MLTGRVVSPHVPRRPHDLVVLDCRGLRVEAEVGNIDGSPPDWLREGGEAAAQVSPHAAARPRSSGTRRRRRRGVGQAELLVGDP